MTSDQFNSLLTEVLALTHETPGVECKAPGARNDKAFLAKIVRAMLGMANRRDGGVIIIGIDNGPPLKPVGLTDLQVATWSHDHLSDALSPYADPSITFSSDIHQDEAGKKYFVIEVREFESIPILCKKAYEGILRQGACYVRTRRKAETAEIPTQEDMRELLDLAVEKGVRKFVKQMAAAGSLLTGPPTPDDDSLFESQLGDLQ